MTQEHPDRAPIDERVYKSPAEGLRALQADYLRWTSRITDISFQCCLALIAANWALHSGKGELLKNAWATWSVSLALGAVLLSLLGAFVLATGTYNAFYEASKDPGNWRSRWDPSERIPSEWPYTSGLIKTALFFTHLKVWVPIISGACFVFGAF